MDQADSNRLKSPTARWRKALFLALLFVCVARPASAQKPMTNDDVIQLVKGGLQESLILEAMDSQPTKFDISAEALVNLKQQGVSEKILLRMMAIATGSNNANTATSVPSKERPVSTPPTTRAAAGSKPRAGAAAPAQAPSSTMPSEEMPDDIPPELAAQIAALKSGAGLGIPGFNLPKKLASRGLPAANPPKAGAGISSGKSSEDLDASESTPASVAYFTTDFSSIQVSLESGSSSPTTEGTLRVGGGRLRFENVASSGAGVTVVNPQAMLGSITVPGKPAQIVKKFDGVVGVSGDSGLSKFFLPVNPENPCGRYKMVVSCKAIGAEVVNGRRTTKWEFTHGIGGREWQTYEWVDSKLHVAIRRQFENHITELRDIKEAPQPSQLFDIPFNPTGNPR